MKRSDIMAAIDRGTPLAFQPAAHLPAAKVFAAPGGAYGTWRIVFDDGHTRQATSRQLAGTWEQYQRSLPADDIDPAEHRKPDPADGMGDDMPTHAAPAWTDEHVAAAPAEALEHDADRLTPDQFDVAVAAAPDAALAFVADRLTPDQFDVAVAAAPDAALAQVTDRLDDAQFADAIAAAPRMALLAAAHELTPEQFNVAVAAAPAVALNYHAARLTDAQRAWCETAAADGVNTAGPFPAGTPDTAHRGGTATAMNTDTAPHASPPPALPTNMGAIVIADVGDGAGMYVRVDGPQQPHAWFSRDRRVGGIRLDPNHLIDVVFEGWEEPAPEPPPWSVVEAWDDLGAAKLVLIFDGDERDENYHWVTLDAAHYTWGEVSTMKNVKVLSVGVEGH